MPHVLWPQIRDESTTIADIYKNYLMLLAIVPAAASFLGMSVLALAFGWHVPILGGLASALVRYGFLLLSAYLLSLLVDAMAPTFGGQSDPLAAFKLSAYGLTAVWVSGVFALLPVPHLLALACSAYSIYLFHTGLPVLMHCPPERTAGYTAMVAICALVLDLLVGGFAGFVIPNSGMHGGGMGGMGGIGGMMGRF